MKKYHGIIIGLFFGLFISAIAALADVDFAPYSAPTGSTIWTLTDNLFNALAANMNDALTETGCLESTGANKFQPQEGSARIYYATTAAPPASQDEGRVWLDSTTENLGQTYVHNGTAWLPYYSPRIWTDTETGANTYTGGSGRQIWDADLGCTVTNANTDWGYTATWTGSIAVGGIGGHVLLELADGTDTIAIQDIAAAVGDYIVTLTGYYEPTVSEARTITVYITCAQNVSREATGAPADVLIVREGPQS